jgi:hypothetical protein
MGYVGAILYSRPPHGREITTQWTKILLQVMLPMCQGLRLLQVFHNVLKVLRMETRLGRAYTLFLCVLQPSSWNNTSTCTNFRRDNFSSTSIGNCLWPRLPLWPITVTANLALGFRRTEIPVDPSVVSLSVSSCHVRHLLSHPASYPMGTRGSFPGGKAAGAWSWPLTSI